LCEKGEWLVEVGKSGDILWCLDTADRFGGHCHGAHRLFVTFMADVDDAVALGRANLDFVVHLGDQRTYRIHHVTALAASLGDYGGGRAMCRQHDGSPIGDL
jgi:hypothetical protein